MPMYTTATRYIALIGFVLLLSFVSACGGTRTPPPDDALTEPTELYNAMLARLEGVQSARIRAVMEYFGDNGRVRVRQAVLAQQPDRLRIETLSPFDSTLSVVLANEEQLVLYDLEAAKFYVGAPTATNLSRLLPLWLTPQDVVRVLLGGPPLDMMNPDTATWELQWDRRRAAYRLSMPAFAGGTLELFVKHETWTLSGARETNAAGNTVWEIRTADFRRVESEGVQSTLPERIRFLMDRDNIDVSLNVSNYDLNAVLPPQLFTLQPPPGVEVIDLDEAPSHLEHYEESVD